MDMIKPDAEDKYFERTITLNGDPEGATAWCVLVESDEIEELSKGRFAIDGQRMYVEVDEDLGVKMESDSGKMRLIAPFTFVDNRASISYNFVW